MKNIKVFSLLAFLLGAIGFTSCSDDNGSNPSITTKPTTFTLNTPALAEQYIQLSADNTVNLTWSQPDYGFAALATYKVQVGLVDNGTVKWNVSTDENGVETPKYLETTYTQCVADINGEEIAQAICEIDGIEETDQYVDQGYREIAMRVYSSILDADGVALPITEIVSNAVSFKHMAAYCAIKSLDYMYLIGAPSGWTEPAESKAEDLKAWRIYETAIGSKVYQGSFYIPAGQFQLRFYSALTGWDGGNSVGSQVDDANVDITFDGVSYTGDVTAPGKGNWQVVDWNEGAYVTIIIDMVKKQISFKNTGDTPEKTPTGWIYICGAVNGWTEPSEANAEAYEEFKLYQYDEPGIYTGTFNFEVGEWTFIHRFYPTLSGWGSTPLAADASQNIQVEWDENGVAEGTFVEGEGNFHDAAFPGGKVKIVVDTNKGTVKYTKM